MPLKLVANKGCCEEEAIGCRTFYIPCNKPATMNVYHKKDNRTYRMCDMCGIHNIRNRGGELRDPPLNQGQ